LLLAASQLAAQQTDLILIDRISEEPVAYAHILVEGIGNGNGISNGYLSDEEGRVSIDIDRPSKITVTFVGYRNLVDTLQPGQSLTLKMEPAVFNVDEVVVTAQYRPETVDKSIYKIKVLGPQLIENKAAVNLTDLLSGELNIRITQDNIFGSGIVMQGLSGEHVKYLVDGVPVIGRQDGQIDLRQLNLINVEHVEVIQGPMSVIYGSNALAGVINIITKESDRQSISVNGEGYYESVGQYNFSLGGSYAKKKNSFSLYGTRNFFNGFNSGGDTLRFQQWKPKLQYNVDGTYKYTSKKTMLKFSGSYFDEEVRDLGNPLQVFNYNKAFDKYYFTRRWVVRGEHTQTFKRNARWNTIVAWSDYRRIRNTYLRDLTDLSESLVPGDDVQDTTGFTNLILRSIYSNSVLREMIQYQVGIDLNWESGTGEKIENNYQEMGDYAAFITFEFIPIPQLSIQPGLRVIYNTLYDAPLTYSLNFKWNIIEPLSLRISTAKGFRAPSLKELYLDFVDLNHDIQGNPNLEAEVAQNINMNLAYNSQSPAMYNWGIDLGLFYNHIEDKIELVQVNAEPLQYSYINVDQFYTHGMELMFNNRVYPWLRLNIGFALTGQRQYVENAVNNSDDYYYYSDFNVQTSYWWKLTDLNFSVFYKYNGSFPQLNLDAEDQVYISTIEPFHTLDINVNRWFWKRRINLQVGGKNLFDVTNLGTTSTGSGNGGIHSGGSGSVPVGWGRTFFVKLQFAFNK
jgi:outer membrane receptor for ferrienterochelin and colicins